MKEQTNVVMLATNEKAIIFSRKGNKGIKLFSKDTKIDKDIIYHNLYITSDEDIKVGNWYYDTVNFTINKATEPFEEGLLFKKIIATTDKSLKIECDGCKRSFASTLHSGNYTCSCQSLPQPSQQFIEKYISEYNKGNIITKVMVEYLEHPIINTHRLIGWNHELMINYRDNTINISLIDNNINEYDFKVIIWPDVQKLMDKKGFKENSQLVNDCPLEREFNGSAYFVRKSWLKQNE